MTPLKRTFVVFFTSIALFSGISAIAATAVRMGRTGVYEESGFHQVWRRPWGNRHFSHFGPVRNHGCRFVTGPTGPLYSRAAHQL
jgi:hypothetical protein